MTANDRRCGAVRPSPLPAGLQAADTRLIDLIRTELETAA